eukprot:7444355-Pyramimonas_sp.AAC.1
MPIRHPLARIVSHLQFEKLNKNFAIQVLSSNITEAGNLALRTKVNGYYKQVRIVQPFERIRYYVALAFEHLPAQKKAHRMHALTAPCWLWPDGAIRQHVHSRSARRRRLLPTPWQHHQAASGAPGNPARL